MKKIYTYGKYKSRNLVVDDWDELLGAKSNTEFPKSKQISMTNNENSATQEATPGFNGISNFDIPSKPLNEIAGLFENLSVSDHSTPIVLCEDSQSAKGDTPVKAPKDERVSSSSDHSFTCRRLVNISLNEKCKRKKLNRSFRDSLVTDTSTTFDLSKSYQSSQNISFKEALCKPFALTDSEDKILNLCGQDEILPIETIVGAQIERKIGEGSYGEVYLRKDGNQLTAVKIVPVGASSSEQMKFGDVVPEMAISRKLSSWKLLSQEKQLYPGNCVEGFIELKRLCFCKGPFTKHLKVLWEEWKEDRENDCQNEHPDVYTEDQKYVVFENRFGGQDLEKCKVSTMKEALSILKQLVATLASAERSIQFEHRDLHWGNILIERVEDKKKELFVLVEGREYEIASCGLIVTIIDFTLARLLSEDCVVYTDLSEEQVLFEGTGDPQFDVYRKMKEANKNDWESFHPYTNVLWIHYVVTKLISKIRQQVTLKKFAARVLKYSSCYDILMKDELFG